MLLIGLNSVKLGVDTYLRDYKRGTAVWNASFYIDFVFNILFTIEAILKCISLGFVMDGGSYLRDGWNKLDFFIVVTSDID